MNPCPSYDDYVYDDGVVPVKGCLHAFHIITVIFFFLCGTFFFKEGSTFFIVLVMVTPNCGAFIFFLECTFEFSILQFYFPWLLIHVPWVEPAQIACLDRTLGRFLDLLKSTILYLLGVFFFCKRLKLIS